MRKHRIKRRRMVILFSWSSSAEGRVSRLTNVERIAGLDELVTYLPSTTTTEHVGRYYWGVNGTGLLNLKKRLQSKCV